MTILLVLFFAVLAVEVLPWIVPIRIQYKLPPQEKPVVHHMRLYSGPLDSQIHEIKGDKVPSFIVAPYVPRDENGMPAPDEDHIVHSDNGMAYVKPNLAYYQQVTDEDYIYVRDITEHELRKVQLGQLPSFKQDA